MSADRGYIVEGIAVRAPLIRLHRLSTTPFAFPLPVERKHEVERWRGKHLHINGPVEIAGKEADRDLVGKCVGVAPFGAHDILVKVTIPRASLTRSNKSADPAAN